MNPEDFLNEQGKSQVYKPDNPINIMKIQTDVLPSGKPHYGPVDKQKPEQKSRFKLYSWAELERLPKRTALVKGLLDKTALSLVYGESNSGKTFFVLDLCLHLVLGRHWLEHKTHQGSIVYIACEGGLGLKERLDAFKIHYKLTNYAPFYLIPTSVNLCGDESDVDEIIREISAIENVQMVIVDTLSRAMAGGNENSSEDMTAFIKNCDKIPETLSSHVMIIHHAGKDSTKGARGHSALRAAVDTEIEIKKLSECNIVTAEVLKQRDGKTGQKFCFQLTSVKIGIDEDGEPQYSCVLESTEFKPTNRKKLSAQKQRGLKIINDSLISVGRKRFIRSDMKEVICITLEQARQALKTGNISASDDPDNIRRTISKVITDLNDSGAVLTYGDYLWLPDLDQA